MNLDKLDHRLDTLDHRRACAIALATVTLVLGGCSIEEVPGPGPSRVEVDTPQLRELKAEAGIEDCAEGDGGGALPAVTLPCLGGGPDVDLATLRGPMIINFWASYCGPCREEMPALQDYYEQHGDRVPVLGIDYLDTQPGAAIELARETGATYPQLADPSGLLQEEPDLAIPGNPFFVFVDADGEIVARVAGGVDSADDVVSMVDKHLGITL